MARIKGQWRHGGGGDERNGTGAGRGARGVFRRAAVGGSYGNPDGGIAAAGVPPGPQQLSAIDGQVIRSTNSWSAVKWAERRSLLRISGMARRAASREPTSRPPCPPGGRRRDVS